MIPESETHLYDADTKKIVGDGDLFVDRLYDGAESLGATVVRTPYSRFLIDLNRYEDDLSPISVAGARVCEADGYYGHRGVIWAVTTRGARVYRRALSADVLHRRLDLYYTPYHRAVREALDRLHARFGYVILLDAHSMPSSPLRRARGAGRRVDIVPGNAHGTTCGAFMTEATSEYWTGCGRSVAANEPYPGGATTRRYGEPDFGYHALQLELNRSIYMNERTLRVSAGFKSLHEQCLGYVRMLAALTPR